MNKPSFFVLFAMAMLAGCRSSGLVAPASLPPAPAATIAPTELRAPERIVRYTLGAYADPDDPAVRHEGHVVYRVEGPATWNFTPRAETTVVTNREPAASATETPTAPVAVATPALLAPPVTPPPPAPAPTVAPSPGPLPSGPQPAAPVAETLAPLLAPNAEGVIDVAAIETAATSDEVNPFAVRATPPEATRELTVHLAGVIGGAQPAALANDRALSLGDTLDALTLARIEPDAAIFRLGERYIRVPVAATATRIRFRR